MARAIIAGEPGEEWTNDTAKVRWQFLCSLDNTCGLCLQFHRQVGPWWPIPMHRACRCHQDPVYPGETARPFVDFRALIGEMPEDQRNRVVGKGALRLIESGTVAWDDVATRGRIRTLAEVIKSKDLSRNDLIRAGFSKARARLAFERAMPEETSAARRSARLLADVFRGQGYAAAEIVKETGRRVAARVGVQMRPDGPISTATRPRVSLVPLVPYAAPVAPPATPPATALDPAEARRLIELAAGRDAAEKAGRLPATVGDLDTLLAELGSKVDHDALRALMKRLGID